MIRKYVSKSSIETFQSCGLKYYIGRVLNNPEPPRKRTVIGSAVHAIMEVLAIIKKKTQEGYKSGLIKHEMGDIVWDEITYNFPSILTNDEVDLINSTRKDKKTYITDCKIKYGTIRYGRDFITQLINKAWDKYCKEDVSFWGKEWDKNDKVELINFTWMCIELLDPRKYKVLDIEKEFDMPIEHEECLINGEYVRVKGFIDLVIEEVPGVISIYDYKTGSRKDINDGQIKDLKGFETDLQLCLYRYVCKKLYPNNSILTSIIYLRDGGTFTPEEIDGHDEYIFNVIKNHIIELKNCKKPKLLSDNREDWKCKYLCKFSKAKTWGEKCDCETIKRSIEESGLDKTTEIFKIG